MKQFYYCLLLFGVSFILNAQEIEGIPVEGLVPIKKLYNSKEITPESASVARTPSTASVTPTGNSTEVGITEGQLSVSLSGAATYSIPIMVPPGINGVMPQVSLAYSSQGSNGMAGYGWNITGISSIRRIPSTTYHDNNIDPVDFDNLDRFALDGKRLIVKNGGIYGYGGTDYETENFSNIKIKFIGFQGNNYGPNFMVEYPDGSRAYYGTSPNSRSLTEFAIGFWVNPQGVRIDYTYNNVNGNLSIASINYGTLGTLNRIQFNYGTSAKPEQMYVGGQSIIQDKILNNVVVTSNNEGFRSYQLAYNSNSIGYQRLTSITEKSGDGTKSLNPTVFSYEDTLETISYSPLTTNLNVGNISYLNAATVSGDFDGNEAMEFLIYPTTGTDAKKKYWLNTSAGSFNNTKYLTEHNVGEFETIFPVSWLTWNNKLWDKQGWAVAKKTNTNYTFTVYSAGTVQPIYYQYERVVNFPTENVGTGFSNCKTIRENVIFPKKILSGDFNGDGLTDVMALDMELINKYISGWCGKRTNYIQSKKVYFVDLKRDNTTNFLTYSGEMLANITADSRIEVTDVNGDGKSDFMVFENGKVTTYTLSSSNQLIMLSNYSDTNISVDNTKTIILGDYNGDGKSDFLIPNAIGSNVWNKYTSTGTGFLKAVQTYIGIVYSQNFTTGTYNFIASDYDKDGKSDLIKTTSTRHVGATNGSLRVDCYTNKNNSFNSSDYNLAFSPGNPEINLNSLPIYLPTGRGIQSKDKPYNPTLEIAFLSGNKVFYFNSNKDNIQDQLLRTITTGNGVIESITYKPLNSDVDYSDGYYEPVYNSSYSETYPNTDIKTASSLNVVSMLEKQSSNHYAKQYYSYFGAVSNTQGLGFLGFKSTARTNWFDDNNQVITTVSKYDTALRGANTENYTVLGYYTASDYAAPSNFITKTTSNYSSTLSGSKVFNLKLTNTQEFNGLNNTSTETSGIVYDAYNNPTESTALIKEAGIVQQTTVSNITYAPITNTPYVIGRPINKTQSVNAYGDTMTTEEQYSYNTGGLLTQINKKGHNTNFITEDNDYDDFGNIIKKTITAVGLTPRITTYEYDNISHRFLTKSTDIEGLSTNYTYNLNNGLLLTETNPYGLTTTYEYDAWFKKTKVTDYLSKSSHTAYTRNGVNTTITTTGDDNSASITYFDDLGRKTKSSIKDINGNYSSVSYLYDIYNRNFKVSEPYFTSPTQWNETEYDAYGRTIKNTAFTGKTTNITYTGLTTSVNDGTLTKTTINNAIGNMVSLTDTPGGTINYTYFANGNLKTTNYEGTITTITQDGWGRKTILTDPSAGIYTYTYNELGENLTETTPNGTTTYTLNGVGRLTKKTIVGTNTNSITDYAYDGTTKLLDSSIYTDVLENGAITTTSLLYDGYKRLEKTSEITPYATFIKQFNYDAFGRLNTETSTANAIGKTSTKTVQHTYKNGYAWKMIDTATQQVLWQTDATNSRGQLTNATMANGNIALANTYDQYGYINERKYDRLQVSPDNISTLTTVFEPIRSNLTSRTNSLFNWNENFTYDTQDRLTSFKNIAGIVETQMYDNKGRITENAVGTYNYANTSKPYQNTSVTTTPDALTYYQANTNQIISYNTFKSPYQIEVTGVDKISFLYNDNNSRSTMFYGGLQTDKTQRPLRKHYSADGSMEIKHNIVTGALEFITYLGGNGYTAPIVFKSDGITQNFLYLQRDYQGSIMAVLDNTGQVLEKRLFDAWGNVLVQDGAGNVLNVLTLLDRGYTGHEHLQSVGLINMNGRIYDAKLHRFLQPDNYVQDATNTQNYNRYGYCWNNPLKYSDASGEWIWIVVGAVVGGVVNWVAHGAQFNVEGLKAFGIGAGAGALAGIIGPAAFTLAGGGAAGAGGFLAGAFGGAAGSFASQTVLSLGNHLLLGDPLMSGKQFITGIAFGAVLGGTINGAVALNNGKSFLNGTIPRVAVQPISLQPAGIQNSTPQQPQASDKLPSTTQTSTAPTTQANTASDITFTRSIDGKSVSVNGWDAVDNVAIQQLDEVLINGKSSGSYLLEFQSGKIYVGKGLEQRMMQSINRIQTNFNDQLKSKSFYPANNSNEAFINEHRLMLQTGQKPLRWDSNSTLYNQIWSPGKKLLGQ